MLIILSVASSQIKVYMLTVIATSFIPVLDHERPRRRRPGRLRQDGPQDGEAAARNLGVPHRKGKILQLLSDCVTRLLKRLSITI